MFTCFFSKSVIGISVPSLYTFPSLDFINNISVSSILPDARDDFSVEPPFISIFDGHTPRLYASPNIDIMFGQLSRLSTVTFILYFWNPLYTIFFLTVAFIEKLLGMNSVVLPGL